MFSAENKPAKASPVSTPVQPSAATISAMQAYDAALAAVPVLEQKHAKINTLLVADRQALAHAEADLSVAEARYAAEMREYAAGDCAERPEDVSYVQRNRLRVDVKTRAEVVASMALELDSLRKAADAAREEFLAALARDHAEAFAAVLTPDAMRAAFAAAALAYSSPKAPDVMAEVAGLHDQGAVPNLTLQLVRDLGQDWASITDALPAALPERVRAALSGAK
jgi:hypothetical protein